MNELMRNSSTCLLVLLLAPVILADDSAKPVTAEKSAELSIAPLDHVVYPDSRPGWVGRSVDLEGVADTIVVVSGPCESPEQSLEELQLMQRAAISTYIARLTETGTFEFYPITNEEIERDLVVRSYSGEVLQGDETHYEHAVELMFTPEKRQQILTAWKQVEVRDRLAALGVVSGLGTVLLICSSVLVGVFSRRSERQAQPRV
jgi:hypothetical protein